MRARLRALGRDDTGSSAVEFVLVGTLLTVLTLAALQLGLAIYVRNVAHDAAVEGAHIAALADTTLADGAERTRQILHRTVGAAFGADVTAQAETVDGRDSVVVRVAGTLPLIGLLGVAGGLEVSAHAPRESLD